MNATSSPTARDSRTGSSSSTSHAAGSQVSSTGCCWLAASGARSRARSWRWSASSRSPCSGHDTTCADRRCRRRRSRACPRPTSAGDHGRGRRADARVGRPAAPACTYPAIASERSTSSGSGRGWLLMRTRSYDSGSSTTVAACSPTSTSAAIGTVSQPASRFAERPCTRPSARRPSRFRCDSASR